jgi:hypothetical protein
MFEQAMRARAERVHGGITGATLPSIIAYQKNVAWPSKTFWDEAGAVLNVRPEWLAFGIGHPTQAHEQVEAANKASQPPDDSAIVLVKRAILGTDGPQASGDAIPYWVAPLADVWLLRDLIPYEGSDAKQLKVLAAVLREPLKALGFSPATMGGVAFNDYVMTMVPVLFGLAAHRAQRVNEAAHHRERDESIRRSVQANTRVLEVPAKAHTKRAPVKKTPTKRRKS